MPHAESQNEKREADAAGITRERESWYVGYGRTPILGEMEVNMTRRERRRSRRFHHFALLTVLLVFIHYWRSNTWFPLSVGPKGGDEKPGNVENAPYWFNWTAQRPSKALNWTDCYERFQCARLTVPMLYDEPSGEEAAVALVMSPSIYPPGHEKYRGPILFNPGGPGGSGVETVLLLEEAFRTILSDGFDLVGFDPRGVGFTTPSLTAFADRVEAGKFFSQFPLDLNASMSSLGEAYARGKILSNLVKDRARYVAERVSTPLVARDMLSIVKAFGQDKIQYWGFSYGTVLGATFAAMFPDNVGRLIIDGVVDTEDYYKGAWGNNLRDTDKALQVFYQSCVAAGPSKCPLYENSTSLVQARVERVLNKLKSAPIPVYGSLFDAPIEFSVIDYGVVRNVILVILYNLHALGRFLAETLSDLEDGHADLLHFISVRRVFDQLMKCDCPAPGEAPAPFSGFYETTYSIACGDAVDRDDDLESVRQAFDEMAKMSSFAPSWPHGVACAVWELRSKERFNGSFEQTTSHPLLLIGNTADPVTPVWNAHKVSKWFKDSVVLTQDSPGHCSIAAASLCTIKAVQDYFIDGTLPEEGKVCDVQSSIFGEKEFSLDTLGVEDRKLMEAAQKLQENYFVPVIGGGGVLGV
ncbi:alpha/beta-hydrolase [Fomitiporia mediterranea MF3/22]|uniref:alpha/beta-hydrolase n=1 Tax=Fomitiporia mediterranea (strain MF3/22) TaxID=694068 RepID=UPI0004407B5C|nr:alpha/beta-hydrolase [Fomitiporia mediterranea MF3/22]EJC98089.1 alpha/beta-hydrolase [Fomitiporia mediterranea MF3/22]